MIFWSHKYVHTWMTLCGQQNSLCFIPVFQSSNMRIKVLSESLHITARKTTFSLTATFTLIFSQTWVRRGLPRNYRGIKFFLSCSMIGVVYLIYLLAKDSGSVSSLLCSNLSVNKVKLYS